MGIPTKHEFEQALAEASRMRERDDDPHHIAKVLLNLDEQNRQLKHVLAAVELYFHSGMAVSEHQKLEKAVEKARNAIDRSEGLEHESFGLR